jgi:superfamily II DNA helicase RecQ
LLIDRAVQQACKMLEEAQLQAQLQAQETTRNVKEIVYCRSRALCKQLAAALDCSAYHAGVESRTEILQDWQEAGGLLVCTSALSIGIDIPSIKFTLHVEQPWGIIDFVQESGRARKEGQAVLLIVAQQSRPAQPSYSRRLRPAPSAQLAQPAELAQLGQPAERAEREVEEKIDNSAAIAAFVRTSGCRRAVMSRYIDSVQLSCRDVQAAIPEEAVVLCDNCDAQAASRQAEEEKQKREAEQEAGVERLDSRQAA